MLFKENEAFLTKIRPSEENKAWKFFKIAPKIILNIGLKRALKGLIRPLRAL